uniref:Peptidase A1 domain-containing protein n=1 Tax=Panagrolaimus superbus TaxID=310955 RepID=A0A914XS25_9BILA
MMFGQAYKIPSGCENMNICGTLGIGMHDDTGEFPPSILYKAFKEKIIQKPIFSVYLEPKSGGENGVLTYGGYDERHCDITKIDTYNFSSSTQYQIQMKSFSFGAKRFFGNWDTFLSPGKAVIWGPPDIINALLQSVNASNNIVQLHFIDCNAKLDPIKLSFDGGKEEYIIEERQQKMPWPYAPPGLCLFPFNSADGDYWILGDPWHRSYCNFFNFGKAKTLGIAKPKI